MMFPSAAIAVVSNRLQVVTSRFSFTPLRPTINFPVSVSAPHGCIQLDCFAFPKFAQGIGDAASRCRWHCSAVPRFLSIWVLGYWSIVFLLILIGVVSSAITLYVERHMQSRVGGTTQRLREFVEALPDAVIVVQDEQVVYINPPGIKLLAAGNEDEVVGKYISEIVHPDSLESTRARLKESTRTREATAPKEHALRSFDGSEIAIESTLIPIRWMGKPAVGAIARDIRDRRQAQAKLKEYEQVLDGLDEMIVVLDRDYRHLMVNRSFLSYRGVSHDEIIGRSVADIVGSEFVHSSTKKRLDACFRGQVVKLEMKYAFPESVKDIFLFPIFLFTMTNALIESPLSCKILRNTSGRHRLYFWRRRRWRVCLEPSPSVS